MRWRQDLLKIQVKILLTLICIYCLKPPMYGLAVQIPNRTPRLFSLNFYSEYQKTVRPARAGGTFSSKNRKREHLYVLLMLRIQAALVDCTIFVGPLDCAVVILMMYLRNRLIVFDDSGEWGVCPDSPALIFAMKSNRNSAISKYCFRNFPVNRVLQILILE